jgi:hypothetical protein
VTENVIPLFPEAAQPTAQGEAFCLQCRHEWQAVVPAGKSVCDILLECPQCQTMTGRLRYDFAPAGNVWECHCGNQLFYITPEGHFCPNCGNFNRY